VLIYRVIPYLPGAPPGQPGHALYVPAAFQGQGRWDNPSRYVLLYAAPAPETAIGEAFANLQRWSDAMLPVPWLAGARRCLAVLEVDETTHPTLDLDDAAALLDRHLRPTDVVIRNRPRTQTIAAAVHDEGRWSGLRWWSYHRPQWPVMALWDVGGVTVRAVEPIPGHPALFAAADTLSKPVEGALAGRP
jgi:hypothetical protein